MDFCYIRDNLVHVHNNHEEMTEKSIDKRDIILEDCECDLFVNVKSLKLTFLARRMEMGQRRTVHEMYNSACTQIITRCGMLGNNVIDLRGTMLPREFANRMNDIKGENVFPIAPYFLTRRTIRADVPVNDFKFGYGLHRAYDMYYLSRVNKMRMSETYLSNNVWQQYRATLEVGKRPVILSQKNKPSGIPWDAPSIPSLSVLCNRTLSVFNQAFGGRPNGITNVTYSLDKIHEKTMAAVLKLKQPTHTMHNSNNVFSSIHSDILNLMIKLLKVEKFKQAKVWDFERELKKSDEMPHNSSGGLRPGNNLEKEIDGILYKILYVGKKDVQIEYANQCIRRIREALLNNETYELDRAWSVTQKHECFAGETLAEIEKLYSKLRLFMIPSITLAKLQRMIHKFRQSIERGNHIAIGVSHWFGGAQMIADRLHYNSGNHIFNTLDFSSLDTTLKACFLRFYSYFTMYYYNPKCPDYDLFLQFLDIVAENLTCKVAHLSCDVWKIIYGGMPSGAFETSHGDSWIVMYIRLGFILTQARKYPSRYNRIYSALIDGDLFFFIYGDDTLESIPDDLNDILNYTLFSKFCTTHLQMVTRDVVQSRRFLSTINKVTGNVKDKGVTFLSKYYVKASDVTEYPGLPDVLPFRNFSKTMKKFAHGDGSPRTPVDYVLASIGMVYDSFGTNDVTYEYCKFMYEQSMQSLGLDNIEQFLEMHMAKFYDKSLNSLVRKAHIRVEHLKAGFPSRVTLYDMHKNDPSKHYAEKVGIDCFDIIF